MLAAIFAGAIVWHIAGIDGAFLADDYGNLYAIFAASERGELWAWVLSLFYSPLGNASNAFRPLQYVSSAFDWLLFGANPVGWRASTIALFFVNAIVGGFAVHNWLRDSPADAALGAMMAACLLAAYPGAGDVAYYPACRADALVGLFSLLYLTAIPIDRRAGLREHVLRLGWLGGALLSKESAMPLPAIATLLCLAAAGIEGGDWRARTRHAVVAAIRETWPSWALLAAYLAWRARLFDSVWKVYVASRFPRDPSEFLVRLSSFRFIVTQNVGAHYFVWLVAVFAALLWAIASQNLRSVPEKHAALIAALCLGAAMYFVAPATSFDVSNDFGEGARHFYQWWIFLSLFLAMLLAWRPSSIAPLVAVVLILFVGQTRSLAQWHAAGMQMQRIVGSIEGFATGVRDDQYALLLLPDHEGVALFARNAEGAIVMRPIQRADYLSRMAIMRSHSFEQWPQHLVGGKVSEFKGGRAFDPANFLGLYCWNPSLGKIVRLTSGAVALDAQTWRADAERNFGPSGCLGSF